MKCRTLFFRAFFYNFVVHAWLNEYKLYRCKLTAIVIVRFGNVGGVEVQLGKLLFGPYYQYFRSVKSSLRLVDSRLNSRIYPQIKIMK